MIERRLLKAERHLLSSDRIGQRGKVLLNLLAYPLDSVTFGKLIGGSMGLLQEFLTLLLIKQVT